MAIIIQSDYPVFFKLLFPDVDLFPSDAEMAGGQAHVALIGS